MKLSWPVRIAVAAAGLVLVGLIALFGFLWSLDLDRFKPLLAEQVRAATGRDLSIEGRLTPRFGLSPSLAIDGLSLSNAGWGEKRPMLAIESFEARLRLLPLLTSLGRHIVVERVVLSGAELWLETDASGGANWRLRTDEAPPVAAAPDRRGERPADLPRIEVLDLEFRRVRVGLKLGKAQPQVFTLEKLALRGEGDGEAGPRWIEGNGRFNRLPFEFGGRIGIGAAIGAGSLPFDLAVRSGGRASFKVGGEVRRPLLGHDYDIAVEFSMPEIGRLSELAEEAGVAGVSSPPLGPFAIGLDLSDKAPGGRLAVDALRIRLGDPAGPRLVGDGTIRDPLGLLQVPPSPLGMELRLEATAPDLSEVARRLVPGKPPAGAARFQAVVRDGGTLRIDLASFGLSAPGIDLSGVGSASFAQRRPVVTGRIDGRRVDLGWLGAGTGGEGAPPSKAEPRGDTRLIPDVVIPYDALGAIDFDVAVDLGALILPSARMERVSLRASGKEGRTEIAPLRFAMDRGDFEIAATMSAADRVVEQRIAVDRLDLGAALTARQMPDWVRGGPTRLRAELRGEGDRLREVLGSAAGFVDLEVGPASFGGTLRRELGVWLTDIAPSLAQIQLGPSLICAAYALSVDRGIATLDQGVVDSGVVALRSAGTLDLGREHLALRTQVGPLGFRTIGSFADPKHRLDAAGTARGVAEGAAGLARSLLGAAGPDRGRAPSGCDRAPTPAPAPAPANDEAPPPRPETTPALPGVLRNLLQR